MNSVNHIIKFLETTSGVSMQDSTKHTPFEAMFGRRARLPIDINAESSYCPEQWTSYSNSFVSKVLGANYNRANNFYPVADPCTDRK